LVNEGFLNLDTWIVYVHHSEGEWARQIIEVPLNGQYKYLSAFERGMVVGARRTGLCEELQRCLVLHTRTVSRVYYERSTTHRSSANLTQL
jgi:hypothetical protein